MHRLRLLLFVLAALLLASVSAPTSLPLALLAVVLAAWAVNGRALAALFAVSALAAPASAQPVEYPTSLRHCPAGSAENPLLRLQYTTLTGAIPLGTLVKGQTSGVQGWVLSDYGTGAGNGLIIQAAHHAWEGM